MTARRTKAGEVLPQRLRWYLAGIGVLGAGVVLVSLLSLSTRSLPTFGSAALALAFFVVGDLALLHIRFGHNNYSFTWSELAVVFGLVMLPSAWAVVVAAVGVGIAQAVTNRPAPKLIFNAASTAIGAALARGVCLALGVADPRAQITGYRTWLVLAAAALMFTFWNSLTVGLAVALSQRVRVWTVLREGALLQILVWLGNTVAGVGMAVVAQQSAGSLVVLPFFLLLLYYVYYSYLQISQDRDSWQFLQDTSGRLARLERAEIAEVVLDRAATLFRAEFLDLLLIDSATPDGAIAWTWSAGDAQPQVRHTTLEAEGTYWPRTESERELFVLRLADAPPAQRRELKTLGLAVCAVVPLIGADGCIGALRVGFNGPVRLRPRELQVLRTFGNQLATSFENARLYDETRDERAKLRRIVDNTSDGILSLDGSGIVSSWNPAMTRMTGVAEADAMGTPFRLGTGATDVDGAAVDVDWLIGLLDSGTTAQARVQVEPPGLERRWLGLSIAAVRKPDGAIESIVVVVRDETALHETNRAKEQFVATVSHELRTPLTSLRGWVSTLLRPEFDPGADQRREIHERLLHQTNRLQHLIEDLLNVSALDRGEFRVECVSLPVDEVVDKALADFRFNAPDRPVSHRPAGLAGMALADPGRVEQVLVNLLSNAHKYSPPGTPVDVVVERTDGEVRISVTDLGYGIPSDQLEAVFEPFHRLGDHMTREQPGTGVGLHIARRLVEAMQGRIWVTSQPGRGSTFSFTLPAAPLVAPAPRPAAESIAL